MHGSTKASPIEHSDHPVRFYYSARMRPIADAHQVSSITVNIERKVVYPITSCDGFT